jgi:hypothetical protein
MFENRNHIKVFIASSVYNFQNELDRLYSILDEYGYDVLISHKGTIPLDSKLSNLDNCTFGVKDCDVFLGFIRPFYGSGVLEEGGLSITHIEFETAYERNIPRFILADYRVVFTRTLFNACKISKDSIGNNKILDKRCIDMYDMAIQNDINPPIKRKGNWVQEYRNFDDIRIHIESQFQFPDRLRKLIGDVH